jgi:hypothetical protein
LRRGVARSDSRRERRLEEFLNLRGTDDRMFVEVLEDAMAVSCGATERVGVQRPM